MAEFPKTYSEANDFPGGVCNTTKLAAEINADATITTGLWRVDRASGNVTIVFKASPSAGEITALDGDTSAPAGGLLAAHDNTASPSTPETVTITGPKTSDGKSIVQPSVFRGDMIPYYTGTADNVAAGTRGDGAGFRMQATVAGDTSLEWQFIDSVYVYAGKARIWNGAAGDYVSFSLYCPATVGVSNTGAGNCDKVALGGGANKFVDAPLSDGDWDVDTSEALNVNLAAKSATPALVTKAVPVPAVDAAGLPIGDWDWDQVTGVLTPNTSGGFWYLLDFPKTLIRWVNRLELFNPTGGMVEEDLEVPIKSKKILPHWKFKVDLHATTVQTVDATWKLILGRAETI